MRKRILFVDDEPKVLDGLRRTLHPMRDEWEMKFAQSGPEGLGEMDASPVDIVVSDMRMPGMDGVEFLTEVKRRWPGTMRIVLSGFASGEAILRSIGPSHQYLKKPCDPEVLALTIRRAESLKSLLGNEALKRLVEQLDGLPAMPELFHRIVGLMNTGGSLSQVGGLIEQDIAMSARVIQMMNSAYFGLRKPAANISEAVSYLGLDTVLAVVMSVQVFGQLASEETARTVETVRQHSLRTALFAKIITLMHTADRRAADDAFTAGLLHDAGELVIVANLPSRHKLTKMYAAKQGMTAWQAQRKVLGAAYTEVGAYLVGLWGLPNPIVEAIAFHQEPAALPTRDFELGTAVHLGNYIENIISDPEGEHELLDRDYLAELGIIEKVPQWLEKCRKLAGRAMASGPGV